MNNNNYIEKTYKAHKYLQATLYKDGTIILEDTITSPPEDGWYFETTKEELRRILEALEE